MRRSLLTPAALLAVLVALAWLAAERGDIDLSAWFPESLFPTPLIPERLEPEDIIRETNVFRQAQGLAPLGENRLLNAAAQHRAQDMLDNGYFAHHNPTSGAGPSEAIAGVGYIARISAENIAKGAWRSNRALVQAWIDSPGHRRNIENPDTRDIGVAVVREPFLQSGSPRPVVYAVQLFALPRSACGEPPGTLALQHIEESRERIERLQQRIDAQRRGIDDLTARIALSRNAPERNRLITTLNQRVGAHNALVEESRESRTMHTRAIADYNRAIDAYNECRPQQATASRRRLP